MVIKHCVFVKIFEAFKKAMTTNDITKRLTELCSNRKFETALKELFAEYVVSIEPFASMRFEK